MDSSSKSWIPSNPEGFPLKILLVGDSNPKNVPINQPTTPKVGKIILTNQSNTIKPPPPLTSSSLMDTGQRGSRTTAHRAPPRPWASLHFAPSLRVVAALQHCPAPAESRKRQPGRGDPVEDPREDADPAVRKLVIAGYQLWIMVNKGR